ncbi:MAG TPA: TolC family protein [Longimicrobiales bacterium]|nr:TolC family protein [Longimicrobiales bacterium]
MTTHASIRGTVVGLALVAVVLGSPADVPAARVEVVPAATVRQQASPAAAQESDTITLTLERAISIAETNNPGYRRTVNQLDVGGAQARATWMGQVLPQVSLNVLNTGYTGNRVPRAPNVFGNPTENSTAGWVYSSSTSQGLQLRWSFQGKDIVDALHRLDVDERDREVSLDGAGFDVDARVRRQYYAVLQQRELRDMETAALEGSLRDQESAERLFRFAKNSRVEVLNAELGVEDQRRAILQQERAFQRARLELRTTLADADLPPFRLQGVPLPVFDPAGLDDAELVERALAVHPDVRQAEVDLEGARLGVSEAKSTRWPAISASYSWGRSAYGSQGTGLFDLSNESKDLSSRFSISVALPYLNDYFQNRQREVQAEVTLRNQRESMKETRLRVEQQVRAQLIELRNQHEVLQGSQRRLDIAEEALRLRREEYRLGTANFDQLQDQVDAERTARRDLINARYNFVNALLDLEDAAGVPVRGEAPVTDGSSGR